MEISNGEIERVEEPAIELQRKLERFHVELEKRGRAPANYNHLGTFDTNLKVLKITIDRLLDVLDY